jgi:hypothetical protein
LTGGAAAIRDFSNQPLQTQSWTFTTASSGDGTAPAVNTRNPASGAVTVGLATNVSAGFSEAVQGVDPTTFTLTNKTTGGVVSAVVSRSGTTNTWILNPNSNLAPDTWYAVTLTGGTAAIRDLANNPLVTTGWEFLTGPAPRISARTPAVNATGVSRTANVIVTFNEPVQAVDGTTFTLKAGTATVSAVVTRSATNVKQWVLNPDATLAANTKYTVTVTGGPTAIRDLVGNPFKTLTWQFTTGS